MFLLILSLPLVTSRHVFVSSPFDNFRMECPKRAAAVNLSIRMVESVGAKRQDVVFDMSCEGVDELFPWVNMPFVISEMEREDCYYSAMFDPILDETSEFSCKRREYLAGITRLSDTRVQIMCCRLRSRDEFNCQESVFNKPIGLTKSTIIEYDDRLINAIRLEESAYIVRFCDLAPRNIADIYNDVKTTTARHSLSTSTKPSYLKVAKFTAALPTTTPFSTTSFQLRKSSNTPSSKRAPYEHSTKPTVQTSTHMDIAEIKTTKEFSPTVYFTSSLITKAKDHTLTTFTTNNATTVRPSREQPSNASTRNEDSQAFQQHTVIQQKGEYPPINVHKIFSKIQQSPSKSAEKLLFKDVVGNLLNDAKSAGSVAVIQPQAKASEDLSHSPSISLSTVTPYPSVTINSIEETTEKYGIQAFSESKTQENFLDDITVNDLSLITFNDEEFPKASQKKFAVPAKFKVSKTNLPLKAGVSLDNFVFLRSMNSNGHRRSPLRTYRPHVEIWSAEEDEMNRGDNSLEPATMKTTRPRKIVKLRKKVTRAHPLPSTKKPNEWPIDYTTMSSEEKSTVASIEPIAREALQVKLMKAASFRRDLPSSRKVIESVTHKVNNAHFVDEETVSSPFEDEEQSSGIHSNLYLRGDEDIEEVIMKLSATSSNIRRAPVRNSIPEEQNSDKNAGESDGAKEVMKGKESVKAKDGSKTYVRKRFPPIPMPEMAIFENRHKGDMIVEDITKVGYSGETKAQNNNKKDGNADDELADVSKPLVLVNSKSFIGGDVTTPAEELSTFVRINEARTVSIRAPPTTKYNPATFYHTPVPKPPKKEKLLTFCTKDIALRDSRNMVVACGGEHDIWLPTRCPQGAECFIAQDSTYRLCCPVSSA